MLVDAHLSHVGGENFRYLSRCFHVFHDVQIQALLQSSEFLTLASQVGSLDEGEVEIRSIEVGMSRDLVRWFQF